MGLMRDAARSTRGRIVIGASSRSCVEVGLVLVAPAKVMPGFKPNARGQVNALVTLTLHAGALPRAGLPAVRARLGHAGRVDRGARRQVAGLNAVARPYWVKRVAPLRRRTMKDHKRRLQ